MMTGDGWNMFSRTDEVYYVKDEEESWPLDTLCGRARSNVHGLMSLVDI
jgi:hypothetical protein